MSSQITLALIGRGHWGRVYQKNIQELTERRSTEDLPSITLPHIYGRDYQDGFKKLNPADVDGVIVAASTSAHYEIATYLVQNGFHKLLIEKPLTRTYTEAQNLEKLIQAYPDAIVMVDHTLLYDPAYRVMKTLVSSKIGALREVRYTSLKTPPIEGDTIIPDAGSPPIYIFLDIAQNRLRSVCARPKRDDNVELTLEFENGIRAVANIGSIYPERKREITLSGEHGTLTLTEFMNPRELIYTDLQGNREILSFSTKYTPLQAALLEFTACITQNKKPATPLSAGVEVVKVIELAEQSLKKGGEPVSL